MLVQVRKAQPHQGQVHVDRPLTNIAISYAGQTGYIFNKVFPIVPVDKQSDKYFTFPKNDWLRDEAERRGDSQESAGSGYTVSTDSYYCDVFGLHKDIGHQIRASMDSPLDPDRDATQFIVDRLMLRQEVQWAADYFVTGVWGTSSTPSNLWSDLSGASDPVADVNTGKLTILKNTGRKANTLVLGYPVYDKLQVHPDIIDRVKYVGGKAVTPELLAQLFDVDRVLVCQAVNATNVENETAAYDFVQGKHALLCHVAKQPGILVPSAGYTFAWKGVSDGLGETVGVSRFYMPEKKAWRVEAEVAFDNKLTGTDLGYMFVSVVS